MEIGGSLRDEDNTALVVLTVILSFCVLLILGVVLSIYCIRKRSHFQAKLKGLSGNEEVEPEAKSDYQVRLPDMTQIILVRLHLVTREGVAFIPQGFQTFQVR